MWWTITRPSPPSARSRGTTCSSNMIRISDGTPGRQPTTAPPTRIQTPGAVPTRLGSISAPRGNRAWTRFRSAMGRFRRANIARMASSASGSSTSGTPATRASASRVRSSWVGPSPPLIRTRSARPVATLKAATFSSRSSPSVVWKWTGTPTAASPRLNHWLFVSSDCPLTISLPIEMISAFINDVPGPRFDRIPVRVYRINPASRAADGPGGGGTPIGAARDGGQSVISGYDRMASRATRAGRARGFPSRDHRASPSGREAVRHGWLCPGATDPGVESELAAGPTSPRWRGR